VRSDVVKERGFGAVAIAAVLLLLAGCARPQGVKTVTVLPSPTPVAHHDPLTISNPVFHSGEVGVAFAPVKLSATGGVTPYTWSIPAGALPGGLTLSSDGVVSGTPTANGYFSFAVQVLDFGGNDTAGVPGSIPIVPRLAASLVSACATECTVELGCVTVCGTFGHVGGGAAPLTYTVTSGALPAGTTLNGLSLNGTFTGLPGRLEFTVQATDGFGATALITARYNLLPHISFPGGAIGGPPTPCYWNGCSRTFPYSYGTGAITAKVVGWQYPQSCSGYPSPPKPCPSPAQPTVSASGGVVTITVPGPGGTWSSGYQGAVLAVQLSDQNLCGPGSYCSTVGNVTVWVYGG
jgi:hypothetical protein